MDSKEFEIMATRLRPRIVDASYRCLGNADDADDVAQDTLLKLWSMRDRLEQYHSVEALAMVISRHLCLDRLKRVQPCSIEDVEPCEQPDLSPEDMIEQEERVREIHSLIDSLPDGQQIILRLKHIECMETAQIAQMIGSSEVAVRVQLSRARARIKELFFNKCL